MTLDYEKGPVPFNVKMLPEYIDAELNAIGRAMSTKELDVAPGYIVRDESGQVIGVLTDYIFPPKTDNALALIGAVVGMDGNITGLRPVGVRGSEWIMYCTSWTVPGMNLPANQWGYTLEVAADGVTVLARPKEAPQYTVDVTAQTDHDLSLTETWVKVTGDSVALSQNIDAGGFFSYGVQLTERADRGGTVEVGVGINGAAPTASIANETLTPNTSFFSTGLSVMTVGLTAGQTVALWCRATNAHGLSDIWVEGSVRETYLSAST